MRVKKAKLLFQYLMAMDSLLAAYTKNAGRLLHWGAPGGVVITKPDHDLVPSGPSRRSWSRKGLRKPWQARLRRWRRSERLR
jgi:hypothetical protein